MSTIPFELGKSQPITLLKDTVFEYMLSAEIYVQTSPVVMPGDFFLYKRY